MTNTAFPTTIAKGDRVILTSDAGEEGATVESLSRPAVGEVTWVTLQMDDRTRYSCPIFHVRAEPKRLVR